MCLTLEHMWWTHQIFRWMFQVFYYKSLKKWKVNEWPENKVFEWKSIKKIVTHDKYTEKE